MTCAAKMARGRTVGLFKGIEEPGNLCVVYADSGVDHRETDLSIGRTYVQSDIALTGEFHRIIEQVAEHPLQLQAISQQQGKRFRCGKDEIYAVLFGAGGVDLAQFGGQSANIHRLNGVHFGVRFNT